MAQAISAFLVPPTPSGPGADVSTGFHVSLFDPTSQLVKLDCPQCPFAQPGADGGIRWLDGMSNALVSARSRFSLQRVSPWCNTRANMILR